MRAFRARTSASRVRRYGRWAARVQERGGTSASPSNRKNRRHLRNTARIKTIRFCRRAISKMSIPTFNRDISIRLFWRSPPNLSYKPYTSVRTKTSDQNPKARLLRTEATSSFFSGYTSISEKRRKFHNAHLSALGRSSSTFRAEKSTRRMTNHKLIKKLVIACKLQII